MPIVPTSSQSQLGGEIMLRIGFNVPCFSDGHETCAKVNMIENIDHRMYFELEFAFDIRTHHEPAGVCVISGSGAFCVHHLISHE